MDKLSVSDCRAEQAIDWYVKLRAEENIIRVERKQFFIWLQKDYANQMAFVEIMNFWGSLGVVSEMEFDELKSYPRIFELKRNAETTSSSLLHFSS